MIKNAVSRFNGFQKKPLKRFSMQDAGLCHLTEVRC